MYTPTYYPPVHYCTTPHCITPQPFPLFCHSLPIAPYHQTSPPPPPPVPLIYPTPSPYHQTAPHPPHPPVPLSYPTPTPYHQTAPHPPPVHLSYPTPTPYHQTTPHPPPLPVPLSYPTPTPPAFYPSSIHCNMYQSLPIPCPCPGPGPGPGPAIHSVNQWIQEPYVPKTASCTQTDLTFSDNPLSSQHRLSSARDNPSRRELSPIPSYRQQQQEDNVEVDCSLLLPAAPGRRSTPFTSTNSQKRFSPGLESPSFDQVREEIYSEVASLISENETRLYHMLKFLRAVRSLNTDYLIQCGLSSLNRVINNFQNPDVIDFSVISPPPPASFLPCVQMSERQQQVKERKETVYSPIQNFPIDGHYYLNTSLSDSSEKVDKRSFPRAYQLSEAVDQHYSLGDKPHDFEALRIAVSDEDNISEVTSYPSEGDFEEGVVSAWKQQVPL